MAEEYILQEEATKMTQMLSSLAAHPEKETKELLYIVNWINKYRCIYNCLRKQIQQQQQSPSPKLNNAYRILLIYTGLS